MKKVIHISQSMMKSAARCKEPLPVIIVKTDRTVTYCESCKILGESVIVPQFNPETGEYKVWIETNASVVADGKTL